MGLNIALDYDGTYTEHPELWNDFIKMCLDHGHNIQIVTFRNSVEDRIPHDLPIEIHYTDGISKKEFMNNQGVDIHIWIDDRPEFIYSGSIMTKEDLILWRKEQKKSNNE